MVNTFQFCTVILVKYYNYITSHVMSWYLHVPSACNAPLQVPPKIAIAYDYSRVTHVSLACNYPVAYELYCMYRCVCYVVLCGSDESLSCVCTCVYMYV